MHYSPNFLLAQKDIAKVIAHSQTEEDPTHSKNTLQWLLQLKPNADEILQLAALAHDIERALPDRLYKEDFSDYEEYKQAHAKRAGKTASDIAKRAGYSDKQVERLAEIIGKAELKSEDTESNLILDADSISYFDNNVELYLKRNGKEKTLKKIHFMYSRASLSAQELIQQVIKEKPHIKQLLDTN